MKNVWIYLGLFCFTVTMATNANTSDDFPDLKGEWFGQKQPGLQAEIFAPSLVSIDGRYEYGIAFSPDLTELYFTALELEDGELGYPEIFYSKLENGRWTQPQKADFSRGNMPAEMLPFVSPTGNEIYFTGGDTKKKDTSMWYLSRMENAWSEPKKFELPAHSGRVFDLNLTANGDLYFTDMSVRKMYYAENKSGSFPEVRQMDVEFGIHGFISPNGDYLVVNARNKDNENRRDNDLFVYFKEKDDTWSKPINLGSAINTEYSESVPRITPDGKFLFFSRYNEPGRLSNFYWVSTDVIAKMKAAYFSE